MVEFDESIFISCKPEDVWNAIADPSNHSRYVKMVDFAEWTSDGPPGVGSTYREVGKFMGRKAKSANEVTRWEPPNQFGYKSVGGRIPVVTEYSLEAQNSGTQLRVHGHLGLSKLFRRFAKKQLSGELEALKTYLESGQM